MRIKFKNLVKRLSLKSTLVAMLFCAASAVGYDAYRDATMTEQERMIQANLEALTQIEYRVEDPALLYNVHEYRLNGNLNDWYCTKDGGSACKRPAN